MNYDIIRISATNAISNYQANYNLFNMCMRSFYKEAIKNPSVASMIFKEETLIGLRGLDKNITNQIKNKKNTTLLWKDNAEYFWEMYYKKRTEVQTLVNIGKLISVIKNGISDWYDSSTKEVIKVFDKKFAELYPNSGYLRRLLLNNSEEAKVLLKKYTSK